MSCGIFFRQGMKLSSPQNDCADDLPYPNGLQSIPDTDCPTILLPASFRSHVPFPDYILPVQKTGIHEMQQFRPLFQNAF